MLTSPAQYTDDELVADVHRFQSQYLTHVDVEKITKAARVAKDIRAYDEVARSDDLNAGQGLPVQLNLAERRALKRERDVAISERGMYIVILTVSLAAFLQGHVQSSINGSSLFRNVLGLGYDAGSARDSAVDSASKGVPVSTDDWLLGAVNASPFLFAAVLGCPLALPINDIVGRRGAMAIAAVLILASSIGSAFCHVWYSLFLVRIVNGLGMGIKAVSMRYAKTN
ncbi:hypothetical protein SCUCBS95973_003601 [Sporothrix curviconia]|uniref:Major facilitator superfamily (MFS) profile domain-containing protein n=1 Tax=Sporothrix curviconia TaxID=1260050 RepID=A0ABP0BGM4_9PEZI